MRNASAAAERRKNVATAEGACCPTSPRRGAGTLARGKPRQRRNPWLCGPESWHPDWGAGTHDAKSPVVTLALLANHRLIFLHPFRVTLGECVKCVDDVVG